MARGQGSAVVDELNFIDAVLAEPRLCEARALGRLRFTFSPEGRSTTENALSVEEMCFSPGLFRALEKSWADSQSRGSSRLDLPDFMLILLGQSKSDEQVGERFFEIWERLNQVPTTHWLQKADNLSPEIIGANLEEAVEMTFESFHEVGLCLNSTDSRLTAKEKELSTNFERLMTCLDLKFAGCETDCCDCPPDRRVLLMKVAQFIHSIDLLEPVAKSSGHLDALESVRRSAFEIHDDLVLAN